MNENVNEREWKLFFSGINGHSIQTRNHGIDCWYWLARPEKNIRVLKFLTVHNMTIITTLIAIDSRKFSFNLCYSQLSLDEVRRTKSPIIL